MTEEESSFVRFDNNPIMSPRPGIAWEQGGVLNPASIDIDGTIYLIYRAVSDKNVSTFGLGITKDGKTIIERPETPIYIPHAPFETRGSEDSNFGAEDPRVVEINGILYFTYTGYNGVAPRVSVVTISKDDFVNRRFDKWSYPEALSPDYIDDKDAAIMQEPIDGKYMVFHRIGLNVCVDFAPSLDFKHPITKCIEMFEPRPGMWDGAKVGIAGPPIKTNKGWLLLYHGISIHKTYRVGAMLLDLQNPLKILSRTAAPVFEPREPYEMSGVVPHVVFPCGTVLRGDDLYLYYGAGDSVVGGAVGSLKALLDVLK
jgi:predicted GH43/DUF377 family glycosyl hydrolase